MCQGPDSGLTAARGAGAGGGGQNECVAPPLRGAASAQAQMAVAYRGGSCKAVTQRPPLYDSSGLNARPADRYESYRKGDWHLRHIIRLFPRRVRDTMTATQVGLFTLRLLFAGACGQKKRSGDPGRCAAPETASPPPLLSHLPAQRPSSRAHTTVSPTSGTSTRRPC